MKRLLLCLLALPAAVHGEPDAHTRALAAGYKAAFLCSGIFNAGQTEAQVAADDLTGIYPEYAAIVPALPATIDRAAKTVSVAFGAGLPPRIAAWRPRLGCAQLPIGATDTNILPKLDAQPPAGLAARPWPTGDAGATRLDRRLDAVIAPAFDHATYGAGTETTAVLVIAGGRIVGERYRAGYGPDVPQRTWSAAKSITATLIGRAVQLDLLDVNAPAPVPEWRSAGDPRAAITMAQLMHMNSGLWTDGPGNRADEIYLGGSGVGDIAAARPLEYAPGTRFNYSNDDTLLALRALRWTLKDGRRALEFPFAELFWRIGMLHTVPETDWRGNFILSSQVWSTARDLGRLGLLYLDDGRWDGQRLLPPGWSRFVATPAPAQPQGAKPGVTRGYGAFFWTMGGTAGLPADAYAMQGNRGQSVIVVPSRNAVIVRRGFDGIGKPPFDDARFAKAVLDALTAPD